MWRDICFCDHIFGRCGGSYNQNYRKPVYGWGKLMGSSGTKTQSSWNTFLYKVFVIWRIFYSTLALFFEIGHHDGKVFSLMHRIGIQLSANQENKVLQNHMKHMSVLTILTLSLFTYMNHADIVHCDKSPPVLNGRTTENNNWKSKGTNRLCV